MGEEFDSSTLEKIFFRFVTSLVASKLFGNLTGLKSLLNKPVKELCIVFLPTVLDCMFLKNFYLKKLVVDFLFFANQNLSYLHLAFTSLNSLFPSQQREGEECRILRVC